MDPVSLLSDLKASLGARERVLVACSGGLDSMALLHSALEVFDVSDVFVGTVNHALHARSDEFEAFVVAYAASRGVRVRVGRACPEAIAKGAGVEDGARRERYRLLDGMADALGVDVILMAHHLDDQVETVMMRLSEGAGLKGLRGMPMRRGRYVRPFIGMRRAVLESYVLEHSVPSVIDPTNADSRFLRNRVRRQLTPQLEGVFGETWPMAVQRSARAVADAESALQYFMARAGFDVECGKEGVLRMHRAELESAGRAVLRTVIQLHVSRAADLGYVEVDRLGAKHVDAMVDLLTEAVEGVGVDLPGAARAWYEGGALCVGRVHEGDAPAESLTVAGPGCYGWGEWKVEIVLGKVADGSEWLAAEACPFPMVLRTPRVGERYRPRGGAGGKRLSRLLIDLKVPRRLRSQIPVLSDGEKAVWVAGLRSTHTVDPDGGAGLVSVRLTSCPLGFPASR